MNFASERNKPIFVTRSYQVALCSATNMVNEALENFTAIRAKGVDDYFVKAAAARKFPKQILVTVDESKPEELKELVTTRLEVDSDVKFEFLDGRIFSGAEAAKEVRNGTEVGRYFFEVEKETLRILQEAFSKGELQ